MNAIRDRVWLIPVAIVLAGVILAITTFYVRVKHAAIPDGGSPKVVTPVTPEDHIIGNPEAPVVIVEYSDIDSEHGKTLQATLEQVMTEYAPGGKVAWVYRHFPVTTTHPYSLKHAIAAECAGSLGNTDAFWRFIDLLHAAAPGGMEFNPANYGSVIKQLGIGDEAFNTCLTSGTFTDRVRENTHNALGAGAEGAPYTAVLVKGQEPIIINGALSYSNMKEVINTALSRIPVSE